MAKVAKLPTEYGASGRWGGRLTKRPLPESDPLLDELSRDDRRALADVWLGRAAMERRVADAFAVIRDALRRRNAAFALVRLAERAIDDEYRHAELSRVVASRFAGEELAAPKRLALEVPKHASASAELRDTLFVVGQCVLNETTASAFLEACLAHAHGAVAKSALRELLSDEIDHGRIGWAHLASLSEATRAEVSRWLLPMAFLNLRTWREQSPEDPEHRSAWTLHGAPPHEVIHRALVDALRTLIVPGLKELRMRTDALDAWLDDGAPTDRLPRRR
ncbi:MAG TPA: hypothetical protein VF103_15530 [Polyangiaceae bacterium]